MRFLTYVITLTLAAMLFSCGNPYKYIGKTYPATQSPELFFREADVPNDFEQMGKLEVEMPEKKSMEKIQAKVEQIAAEHGADAVMIDNFDMTTGGFTTVDAGGGKVNKDGGAYGVSSKKTKVDKNVQVRATLLKYKQNINRK